ncbi:Fe-S_protein assembly chaperone HscA domain-containing protein [Hexamita inflata]|uniref:Fe-S protein assembly chaperone HscA domain-containing protein n=1 Tax=Hexamita inflata TaxID=28002 RepID=A0AA86RMY9_9EUKA|nr:Fe-S protein assembly chaperone HscA domain-containing protein [Hexamita inflata]
MLGTLRQKRISLSSIVEAFLIKCLNGVSSFIDFKENCMETQFILLFPDIRNNAVEYFKTCFQKALQMFQSNRNDTQFFNSSFTTISRLYPGIKVLLNSQNSCLIDDSQIIQLDETQKNIIVCNLPIQQLRSLIHQQFQGIQIINYQEFYEQLNSLILTQFSQFSFYNKLQLSIWVLQYCCYSKNLQECYSLFGQILQEDTMFNDSTTIKDIVKSIQADYKHQICSNIIEVIKQEAFLLQIQLNTQQIQQQLSITQQIQFRKLNNFTDILNYFETINFNFVDFINETASWTYLLNYLNISDKLIKENEIWEQQTIIEEIIINASNLYNFKFTNINQWPIVRIDLLQSQLELSETLVDDLNVIQEYSMQFFDIVLINNQRQELPIIDGAFDFNEKDIYNIIQPEIVNLYKKNNEFVLDKYCPQEITDLKQLENNYSNFNKICIDQGTFGSQAVFLKSQIQYINEEYQLEVTQKEDYQRYASTQHTDYCKIPSFCILNIDKLAKLANQLQLDLEEMLCNVSLSPLQLSQILSFSSIQAQNETANKKSKFSKKAQNTQQQNSNIVIIEGWKMLLYEQVHILKIQTNYQELNRTIQVPLKLIYKSQLQFFKQRLLELNQNGHTHLFITVPCCAQENHLNFIRECAVQAGWSPDISFVYEPISAFSYLLHNDQNSLQGEGKYLIIDIGGGSTDISIINLEIKNKKMQLNVVERFNQKLAGRNVDNEIISGLGIQNCLNYNKTDSNVKFHINQVLNYVKCSQQDAILEFKVEKHFIRNYQDKNLFIQYNISSQIQEQYINELQLFLYITKDLQLDQNNNKIKQYIIQQLQSNLNSNSNITIRIPMTFCYQIIDQIYQKINLVYSCTIQSVYVEQIMKSVINKIIISTKQFLSYKNINESTLKVLCVGGIGSSQACKEIIKDSFKSSHIINIQQLKAQKSISRGGLFLDSEKDHVNFEANFTSFVAKQQYQQMLNQLDKNFTLELEYSHLKDLEYIKYKQIFVKQNQMDEVKSSFYCRVGWDGLHFNINTQHRSYDVYFDGMQIASQMYEYDLTNSNELVKQEKCLCQLTLSDINTDTKKQMVLNAILFTPQYNLNAKWKCIAQKQVIIDLINE